MRNSQHRHPKYLIFITITLIGIFFLLLIELIYLKSPIFAKEISNKSKGPISYEKVNSYEKTSNPIKTNLNLTALPLVSQSDAQIHLPILLYHKTPENFDTQMKHLKDNGYTPVFMSEAADILNKKIKPPLKPVVITFDDGFTDQFKAFDILKKYNFKATSYIIVGGQASDWCIGANKKSNTCGDAYMNWEDIKVISKNPLIEIGSHTIDHLQLSSLSEKDQRFQIIESKKSLEEKLGIPIKSFAYPYGKYNDTSIRLAKEAGYTSATGVNGKEEQSQSIIYILNRIRDTKDLK